MRYHNYTPHAVTVGGVTYQPRGPVARVQARFGPIVDGVCHQTFGDVEGLPDPQREVRFIVSGLVFAATDRKDVVAPATGHPEVVRNEHGHIVSVPAFIEKAETKSQIVKRLCEKKGYPCYDFHSSIGKEDA